MTSISFRIGEFDTARSTLIVAEIGSNHEGDFGRARELLDGAIDSGADAVKFQTIVPERLVAASETARIAQLRRYALTIDQFAQLAEQARRRGAIFMSTPFDTQTIRDLDPLVPAFKVASGDNDWPELLQAIAATAKPVVLSTGLLDFDGARCAAETVTQAWTNDGLGMPGLCLLHCVSAYPCPEEQANLSALRTLAELGFPVGYSDHTLGIEAAVLSVVLGACVVEKHFTLNHQQSDFRDHALSANPVQMTELVQRIRSAERLMGDGVKRVMPAEEAGLVGARRGLAVVRDLPAGHLLTGADLAWLRPRKHLGPDDLQVVLGRTLRVAKAAGTHLSTADLADRQ